MTLYVKLDKDINPNWLLQKLQHKIFEHSNRNNLENSVLCIEIKNINHVVEDITRETIARLENKDNAN